jgi:hypothetical protein
MLLLVLISCAPGSEVVGPPFSVDLLPPLLQQAEVADERLLRFTFDEPVARTALEPVIVPALPVGSVEISDNQIEVALSEDQVIGQVYTLRMAVEDQRGNTLSFLYEFSGWNPRVPSILINELNPRGSGNNPDCIELHALTGGNLGGLCIRVGTTGSYSGQLIFPEVEIEGGDFIVVHAKAEGIPEEISETGNIDESGGLLATDYARDFWIPDSPGLPGNNGAVTLYSRKGGPVLDAVIWSDRPDAPGEETLGWTSEGYTFASDLGKEKAWKAEGPVPLPSEVVDVTASTATRSLCRPSIPADTD